MEIEGLECAVYCFAIVFLASPWRAKMVANVSRLLSKIVETAATSTASGFHRLLRVYL